MMYTFFVAQSSGTYQAHIISNPSSPINLPEPSQDEYCGRVYAHVYVDSDRDLAERQETNNVQTRPVTLLCQNGNVFRS